MFKVLYNFTRTAHAASIQFLPSSQLDAKWCCGCLLRLKTWKQEESGVWDYRDTGKMLAHVSTRFILHKMNMISQWKTRQNSGCVKLMRYQASAHHYNGPSDATYQSPLKSLGSKLTLMITCWSDKLSRLLLVVVMVISPRFDKSLFAEIFIRARLDSSSFDQAVEACFRPLEEGGSGAYRNIVFGRKLCICF